MPIIRTYLESSRMLQVFQVHLLLELIITTQLHFNQILQKVYPDPVILAFNFPIFFLSEVPLPFILFSLYWTPLTPNLVSTSESIPFIFDDNQALLVELRLNYSSRKSYQFLIDCLFSGDLVLKNCLHFWEWDREVSK